MGSHLDRVPSSGIIRIRDMMFTVKDPFRLDQGVVSFDAPDTVKQAMIRALAENRTHYVQTAGTPALRERLADKLRRINGVPVRGPEDVLVSNGGIHAIYAVCHALREPGDEVVIPDPLWPPAISIILSAHGVPVGCPLRESMSWRWDLDELRLTVTPRTRAIYVNSPNNPTGGVLTRDDLAGIARLAAERGLWIISDEAYEDVIYEGPAHVSCASFEGRYPRTIPVYTFSKTYAMTGLRLGYLATCDETLRDRKAFRATRSFWQDPASLDLYDAASQIKTGLKDPNIRAKSQAVMGAVNAVVLDEWHVRKYKDVHGIAIFIPTRLSHLDHPDTTVFDSDYYHSQLDFAKDTRWDEFLAAYLNFKYKH